MTGPGGRWILPGRWLVPLLLTLFALLTAGTKYLVGVRQLDAEVTAAETSRLRERLTVEQSRLNLQANPSSLAFVRGAVSGMGLYKGLRAAWLLTPGGRVQAAISRADIDRDFADVAASRPELLYLDTLPRGALDPLAIVPRYRPGGQELVGAVPLSNGRRLVVLVDISVPLAQRHAALRQDMLRETLLLLALAGVLGLVLHFAWFRRAEHLARSLTAMGEGRLQARTGLQGFDELALIGAAADRMAERLQRDQARLQRLHALVERSPAVVIEWANEAGWPLTFLSGAVAQWGYDAQDLLSGAIDWDDLVHPDDIARMNAEIAAHWAAGRHEYRQEYRLRRADGDYAWVDDRTSITRRPDGEVDRISGILLDITALKQAQLALQRTNAELEHRVHERTEQLSAANRELEAFTYMVSHDLKAPLRGIDGFSQLLEEEAGPALGEEARGFVRRIRRGVRQMSDLINDLLDYSRMERRAMDPQPLDVPATVRRVLEEFGADIERSRAEVRLALSPLRLCLDREGMAVVLRNLVGNALKFARPGEPPRIEIGGGLSAGGQRLWVRDHGVGFDMQYHDRIFGIFQRLQRAEDYPGTGVGLALVAKAVQRMGGRVWAESVPGEGTTFFLEFPG